MSLFFAVFQSSRSIASGSVLLAEFRNLAKLSRAKIEGKFNLRML
jgi:hypothetical protein